MMKINLSCEREVFLCLISFREHIRNSSLFITLPRQPFIRIETASPIRYKVRGNSARMNTEHRTPFSKPSKISLRSQPSAHSYASKRLRRSATKSAVAASPSIMGRAHNSADRQECLFHIHKPALSSQVSALSSLTSSLSSQLSYLSSLP
ncbi:Unannotated [Lentimonas sp. CC4]|nr:Unannotated [Lentimonas sp. CC4]CAA6686936.1 Unannotated [Lentimonas sp. CC6]CAA7074637.1 Unannotated [Lentimonas sp. CC4]CAA7169258.1 Unannotated [Lentimonas sp. CC21]CAA7180346.1 Unannotated [Lentimonas sp. CC8]